MEHSITQYEVLVMQQRSNWVSSSPHQPIPPGAILGGNDVDGSPIYVGRAHHDADQVVAKVLPTRNVAYIAYNGQGIYFNTKYRRFKI